MRLKEMKLERKWIPDKLNYQNTFIHLVLYNGLWELFRFLKTMRWIKVEEAYIWHIWSHMKESHCKLLNSKGYSVILAASIKEVTVHRGKALGGKWLMFTHKEPRGGIWGYTWVMEGEIRIGIILIHPVSFQRERTWLSHDQQVNTSRTSAIRALARKLLEPHWT